ncbi:hypothetical protein RESH_03189 [Rhodopirellula europaea SH398]|uniref:Uncharacterized protein n=1 Tax=Rhodopirellula europaea SH398 TaxID=1263868 RepID=M5S3F2_9BACT|nr:hypothetical protein RESH_03189 [Rhodopirellula europaea SH398]
MPLQRVQSDQTTLSSRINTLGGIQQVGGTLADNVREQALGCRHETNRSLSVHFSCSFLANPPPIATVW